MFALHQWSVAHVTMKGCTEHKGDKTFGVVTIFPKVRAKLFIIYEIEQQNSTQPYMSTEQCFLTISCICGGIALDCLFLSVIPASNNCLIPYSCGIRTQQN